MKKVNSILLLLLSFTMFLACGGGDEEPEPEPEPEYEVTSLGVRTNNGVKALTGSLDKIPVGETVQAGFYYWEPEPGRREHKFPNVATLTETGTFRMEIGTDFATGPGYTMRAFVVTRGGEEILGRTVPF